MVLWKAAKYTALSIGMLVLVGVAISVVATILGIAWSILTAIATLLVLVGFTYATIQGVRWLRSDGTTDPTPVDTGSADPVERLTDRYVSGDLTEEEFERRLALELDGPDGEIDRELQRSRTER
jgi:uncharacterized membrane protein